MQGLHLTADLYGCGCDPQLLVDAQSLAARCRDAVADAGLTRVADRFFAFPPWQGQAGGVTGVLLLAESHLAVHTWPERGSVTLDVYVCNFSTDNSARAERLMQSMVEAFAPVERHAQRLIRGAPGDSAAPHGLLLEWLDDDAAFGYRASAPVETVRTPYQTLEVLDSRRFGRLFRLDGRAMTSERDEFFYHENIVHPAALTHPAPRAALVIGGGDGGSTEELLKHPTMRRVVMAELDEHVVRTARRHLQAVHRGALDDPRLEIHIGDGFAFVEQTDERFDLIVLDLTDPDTPAHRLYTREFFALARRALAPGGAITLHVGTPVFKPELVARLVGDLRATFAIVRPYFLYVPLYGALWGMACASDTLDPLTLSAGDAAERIAQRDLRDLHYYNADVHRALFALPTFVRDLLA